MYKQTKMVCLLTHMSVIWSQRLNELKMMSYWDELVAPAIFEEQLQEIWMTNMCAHHQEPPMEFLIYIILNIYGYNLMINMIVMNLFYQWTFSRNLWNFVNVLPLIQSIQSIYIIRVCHRVNLANPDECQRLLVLDDLIKHGLLGHWLKSITYI